MTQVARREPNEAEVLARAKRIFLEKNADDRAWDEAFTEREAREGRTKLCLTDTERAEYIAQARHALREAGGA